ncbi:MAG: hypothetical protein N4A39_11900 [Roseicyclus sp.]|nr:hypothetical protein [Roseicyclus sp.]
MNWTQAQIMREAGFQTKAQFSNESHRHHLPFRPKKRGVENRFSASDLAVATILRRLRGFGVPTSRAAELLQTLDRDALDVAVDALTDGRGEAVIVGIAAYDLDLLPQGWTGVFTSAAAAAAAHVESDLILVDVGTKIMDELEGLA